MSRIGALFTTVMAIPMTGSNLRYLQLAHCPRHSKTTEFCRIWYSTCFFLQVKCGVRASLDQACNAVGYVDRQVWGINHLYTQPVWIRSKVLVIGSMFSSTTMQYIILVKHWSFYMARITKSVLKITLIRTAHSAHRTWVPCELMLQSGAVRLLNQKAC